MMHNMQAAVRGSTKRVVSEARDAHLNDITVPEMAYFIMLVRKGAVVAG